MPEKALGLRPGGNVPPVRTNQSKPGTMTATKYGHGSGVRKEARDREFSYKDIALSAYPQGGRGN